jgi:hypothetical protein
MKMKLSPFLTSIARDYEAQIAAVYFEDLSKVAGEPLGMAYFWRPSTYYISIDCERLICPHQVLYALFHEMGHIVQYHLGYRRFLGAESYREEEADAWAFRKMGMIDECGNVEPECAICYECMRRRSRTCLKHFEMGRNLPTG